MIHVVSVSGQSSCYKNLGCHFEFHNQYLLMANAAAYMTQDICAATCLGQVKLA